MSVSSEITRIQNEVSEQTELISQIQTTVSTKSSSNMNIYTTIDTTLTQEGQAADAKATGDAINNLSSENAELKDDLNYIENSIAKSIAGEQDNLFAFKVASSSTTVGTTFTSAADGSISIDGSPTANCTRYLSANGGIDLLENARIFKLTKGIEYSFGWSYISGTFSGTSVVLIRIINSEDMEILATATINNIDTGLSYIPSADVDVYLAVYAIINRTYSNYTFKPFLFVVPQIINQIENDIASLGDSFLPIKNILPDGQDMNELLELGIYIKSENRSWTNYPEEMKDRSFIPLVVVLSAWKQTQITSTTTGIEQIIVTRKNGIFYRYKSTDYWDNWIKVGSKPDLIKFNTAETMAFEKIMRQVFAKWVTTFDTMPYLTKLSTEYGVPSTYANYSQGDSVEGIPYSGMIQNGNDVFFNRTIQTFLSAVKNPASILYTDALSTGRYQSSNYGAICSSFAGWLMNQDIYRATGELQSYIDFYDYQGIASVDVGDVLLSTGHIKVIIGFNMSANNYAPKEIIVAEQGGPGTGSTTHINYYTEMEIQELLDGGYKFGRYPNATIRELPTIRYADDIITNRGNDTYFYADEETWLYAPNANIIYYSYNDEAFAELDLSTLPNKVLNGVTIYDVTNLTADIGTWRFTTDVAKSLYCTFLRINAGYVSISNKTATIGGYSTNITPIYSQLIALCKKPVSERPDSTIYPAPSDPDSETCYSAVQATPNGKQYITGETFTLPVDSDWDGYYVRVWYRTDYGTAYCDSPFYDIQGNIVF